MLRIVKRTVQMQSKDRQRVKAAAQTPINHLVLRLPQNKKIQSESFRRKK